MKQLSPEDAKDADVELRKLKKLVAREEKIGKKAFSGMFKGDCLYKEEEIAKKGVAYPAYKDAIIPSEKVR